MVDKNNDVLVAEGGGEKGKKTDSTERTFGDRVADGLESKIARQAGLDSAAVGTGPHSVTHDLAIEALRTSGVDVSVKRLNETGTHAEPRPDLTKILAQQAAGGNGRDGGAGPEVATSTAGEHHEGGHAAETHVNTQAGKTPGVDEGEREEVKKAAAKPRAPRKKATPVTKDGMKNEILGAVKELLAQQSESTSAGAQAEILKKYEDALKAKDATIEKVVAKLNEVMEAQASGAEKVDAGAATKQETKWTGAKIAGVAGSILLANLGKNIATEILGDSLGQLLSPVLAAYTMNKITGTPMKEAIMMTMGFSMMGNMFQGQGQAQAQAAAPAVGK